MVIFVKNNGKTVSHFQDNLNFVTLFIGSLYNIDESN